MSQFLDDLPLNSTADIKGPIGELEFLGRGSFDIARVGVRTGKKVFLY
jgi:nitrate reductase (NAD(P)H)